MPAPYTLGFFGDGPDTGSFAGDLTNFEKEMGITPTIFNVYMDFTQPTLPNTGSAAYDASSFDNSGLTKNSIPLVGMTLSSSADSTATNVTFMEQLASSTQFDAQIEGFVNDWKAAGFPTVYWRPVVEMNLTSTPGFAAWESNPSVFINAFQKAYTLLHAASKAAGMGCVVIWNPGCSNSSPAGLATETLYPGDGFVDQIGGDIYDDLWPMAGSVAQIEASPASLEAYYNNPAEGGSTASCLSLDVLAAFALAHNKPLCIPETGCGANPSDNPTFPAWLRAKLDSWVAKGLTVSFVSIWSNGVYNFLNGSKPNEAAAWAANFGVNAPAIAKPTTTTTTTAASPNNTTITEGRGSIVDTKGQTWTIKGGQFYIGSTVVSSSWEVVTGWWNEGALYQENSGLKWYDQPLSNTSATPLTGTPPGYTAPTTTTKHAASPAGTTLPAQPIYDTAGTAWTLPTVPGQIYRQAVGAATATAVASSKDVVRLWWDGTNLSQLNSEGQWWPQPLDGSAGQAAISAPAGYSA